MYTRNEQTFTIFRPAKSKSDVYFCQPEPETLGNSENRHFPGYRGFWNEINKKSTSAVQLLNY